MKSNDFVNPAPSDDKDFAGSLHVRSGKNYLVELPNGDAVTLRYDDKNGPSLQVSAGAWCEKTRLDVVEPRTTAKPAETLNKQCDDKDCYLCAFLRMLGVA